MAGTATPPPAAPAAPATPPPAPAAPPAAPPATPPPTLPGYGPAPQLPSMMDPDKDPNLAMSKLVAKSRDRQDKGSGKGAEPSSPPAEPQKPPGDAAPGTKPPEAPKLIKLLGKSLKFGEKPAAPGPGTPQVEPPAAPAAPAAAAPPAEPPAEPPKPRKGAKKVALPPPDPLAMAREAATAATQAALQTLGKGNEPADPTAELAPQDKRDYEIATHLAKMDARYKDAPKIILEHVRMAEEYSSNWERANPGKLYDPRDEEHNEFFAKLARPWTPEEFTDAAIDLKAEQKFETREKKFREEQNAELDDVRQSQGRVELAPVVDQHFSSATLALAQLVDPALHQALSTNGWDGLSQADPVMAEVMGATLQRMHPFIETAIQLDDPRGRFKLNLKDPVHQQWNHVVMVGENNLVGTQLDDGRMFAKRSDYGKMSSAEQSQHWYLTTEMIIQGGVQFAAGQVQAVAQQQKKRLEEMGYSRDPQKTRPGTQPAGGAPTTPQPPTPGAGGAPSSADKPLSPTVGSGVKIDQPGGNPLSSQGRIIQLFSKVRSGS